MCMYMYMYIVRIPFLHLLLTWTTLRKVTGSHRIASHRTQIMLYSCLGLQRKLTPDAPDGGKRVHCASRPKRHPRGTNDQGVRPHVKVLKEHATSPQRTKRVQCIDCDLVFVGGRRVSAIT